MQPHSTLVLSLANYIYNFYKKPNNARGMIRVEYQDREGKYRSLIYSFDSLKSRGQDFRRGFSVWVKKSGDPLSCMLHVETSDGEYYPGKHFVITHGTQHVSGLEEHFDLYQKGVRSGHHLNSMKYDNFDADFLHEKQITVYTNLRQTKTHEKKSLRLQVKIEQINYQEEVEKKPIEKPAVHTIDYKKREEEQRRRQEEKKPEPTYKKETISHTRQHRKEEPIPADASTEETPSKGLLNWKDALIFVVLAIALLAFAIVKGWESIRALF